MDGPSLLKQPRNCQNQLRFCTSKAKREMISLLVVGSSEFCHLMSESIHAINKKMYRMELSIAKAESIESVLKSSSPVHVDFIAFLMNTGQRHCIEQVERDICQVEPIYLCDKMILINGSNQLTPSSMGLSHDELFNLKEKYRLHLFHGNVKDESNCANLAKRILNFMFVVCGKNTGTPMVLDFHMDKYPMC